MLDYEWFTEEIDSDGEILDIHFTPSARSLPTSGNIRCGLKRDDGDDHDGVRDRQLAYIVNGHLPATFDGGARIPIRFRTELRNVTH